VFSRSTSPILASAGVLLRIGDFLDSAQFRQRVYSPVARPAYRCFLLHPHLSLIQHFFTLLPFLFPGHILSSNSLIMQLITSLVAAAILASNVIAHPGQSAFELRQEIAERAEFMKHSKKDLSHCAAKMKARGLEQRAIARRTAIAKDARRKRSITASKLLSSLEVELF